MPDITKQLQQLQESITRIEQRLTRLEQTQQPAHDIKEIKSRVLKEAISSAREREEILNTLKALQQTISLFEAQRTPKKPTPVPADARVGIFVDVQNIFYAAKQFGARLDFEKLLTIGVGKRRLIRAIAYVVQSPGADQSSFFSMLQQKSYEVRRKDLRQRSDGSAKGDWDMGMAIDIMKFVNDLDVVVLVSGDGDFVPLVDLVKTIGPRVEVISFTHNTARDLIHSADTHIPIEDTLLLKIPQQSTQ